MSFSSEKSSGLNQERNLLRSSTVYKPKQSKQICGWTLMWEEQEMDFFTGENVIMDYMLSILARRDIFKVKSNNDVLFLTTCSFSLCKMLTDGLSGVDYCDVFINSHSDGTHSLLHFTKSVPIKKLILSKIQSLLEQVWFLQLSANELIWISCVNKTNVEKPPKVQPRARHEQPWSHEPLTKHRAAKVSGISQLTDSHARCKDHDTSGGPACTVSRTSCVLGIDWAWRTSERHTRQHCRFSLN